MHQDTGDHILAQQIAYYRARAGEYDEWFYREGRYDRGKEANRKWFDELRIVSQALGRCDLSGDVLELACGTGIWTQVLARRAQTLTAIDASPEVIAINRAKLGDRQVSYIQADLFAWQPDRTYDAVFFSFWLSHVPPKRLLPFLRTVRTALRPGGKVFFIDSLYEQTSTAQDHTLSERTDTLMLRRLNDGREFTIVKVFYEPAQLDTAFADAGIRVSTQSTSTFFLYGCGVALEQAFTGPK